MKIEKFKVLLYLKKSGMDKNGKTPNTKLKDAGFEYSPEHNKFW